MKLNYTMKSNGMYILSVRDFDDIATLVLTEYQPNALEWPQPVNIDYLATECLYLDIKHEHISINGSILGMIAFSDTEISGLDILYRPTVFQLSEGTMLIDSSLIGYEQRPRARFTKAHEVGHWICHRSYHSPDNRQYEFRRAGNNAYVACRTDSIERYKYKKQKTNEDWEEWQADHFAAAILMPVQTFEPYARQAIRNAGVTRGYLVKGQNKGQAYEAIEDVAERFTVSKRAAQIRMQQLGLIIDDSYSAAYR